MSVAVAIALVAVAAAPQSPAPRLASLAPAGGTRGTEVEVTLRGERVAETVALQFDEPGLAVVACKPAADRCVATLRVAPDCRLGAHRLVPTASTPTDTAIASSPSASTPGSSDESVKLLSSKARFRTWFAIGIRC